MQTLLEQCVYGAKIDNDDDFALLGRLVRRLFDERSYVGKDQEGDDGYIALAPEKSISSFQRFLEKLAPAASSPALIGLPDSAETALEESKGTRMLGALKLLSD